MAAILKIDPAWLQYGVFTETKTREISSKQILEKTNKYYSIPIFSWEQIEELLNTSETNRNETKEFILNLFTDNPAWFALKVKGCQQR